MYRFRSIYNLLDGHHELENQEIYFAPSKDLNDPMEGFLDVFWDGDVIVWGNLLKHFLMCFEQLFVLNIIGGETMEIKAKEIPVFKNRSIHPTNDAKDLHSKLEKHFFNHNYISKFSENLAARGMAVRRDELIAHLRLVHAYAFQSIIEVYQQNGLINTRTKSRRFDDLQNFIKEKDPIIDLLKRAEEELSEGNQIASIFFSVAGKVSTELNLLIALRNSRLSSNSNKFFLHYEFPQAYVSRIEEIVYPDWYTACFMTSCSNSSVWGHYGEQHKGVCLKFKTQSNGDEFRFNIDENKCFEEASLKIETIPFHKVNYENKHIEIDFFKSLGRLQVFMLRSQWYTDTSGNLSKCANPISDDPDIKKRWHNDYWQSFYKGVTTKLEDWSYENEYRLILTNMLHDFDTIESRKLKYDFNSLEGIIFGIKTTTEDKLKIIRIIEEKCKKYNRPDFNFYQAYYSKVNGKIKYSPLDLIK